MSNRQTHREINRPTQSGPAQLDAGLLVRKGAALPAGYRAAAAAAIAPVPTRSSVETTAPTPAPTQQAAPAATTPSAAQTSQQAPKPAAKNADAGRATDKAPQKRTGSDRPGSNRPGERARISIRLDHDRHLRLRIAAAHLDRSLQDIMTDALDRYLDEAAPDVAGGNCECLAMGSMPAPGSSGGDNR